MKSAATRENLRGLIMGRGRVGSQDEPRGERENRCVTSGGQYFRAARMRPRSLFFTETDRRSNGAATTYITRLAAAFGNIGTDKKLNHPNEQCRIISRFKTLPSRGPVNIRKKKIQFLHRTVERICKSNISKLLLRCNYQKYCTDKEIEKSAR